MTLELIKTLAGVKSIDLPLSPKVLILSVMVLEFYCGRQKQYHVFNDAYVILVDRYCYQHGYHT